MGKDTRHSGRSGTDGHRWDDDEEADWEDDEWAAGGRGGAPTRPVGRVRDGEQDERDDDHGDRRIRLPHAVVARLDGARLRLTSRHAAVIAVLSVAVIAWSIWSLHRSAARAVGFADGASSAAVSGASVVTVPPVGSAPGSAAASTPVAAAARSSASTRAAGTTAPTGPLIVDVAGKVRSPGLVRLAPGARVGDALTVAGGALPGVDLTNLNLARRVVDGEQITVGVVAAATPPVSAGPPRAGPTSAVSPRPTSAPSSTASGNGTPVSGAPVDLNTADATQLDTLPGVGPVMAQRILDWRTQHGRFGSVDDLQEVEGIGPKKFAQLQPHVTVR